MFAAGASVLVLIALQAWAATNFYALRVIGDTPTFMVLIRDMAIHPLHPVSAFFGTGNTPRPTCSCWR
jgi:hypothetical protein